MAAQPTVLCIDDEESGLRVRKLLFEAKGYRVVAALSGHEGIDFFKTKTIDAVILDYSMPEMDGAAVAKLLKRLRPRVPIIMLSGQISVPTEARPSIDAFLPKGQSPGTLLATTASLLKIRNHSASYLRLFRAT